MKWTLFVSSKTGLRIRLLTYFRVKAMNPRQRFRYIKFWSLESWIDAKMRIFREYLTSSWFNFPGFFKKFLHAHFLRVYFCFFFKYWNNDAELWASSSLGCMKRHRDRAVKLEDPPSPLFYICRGLALQKSGVRHGSMKVRLYSSQKAKLCSGCFKKLDFVTENRKDSLDPDSL